MWLALLQSATALFITKCDEGVLQSATIITKCDSTHVPSLRSHVARKVAKDTRTCR